MLTFSVPEGQLCMIVSSQPDIPMRARERTLNYYVNEAADTQANNIVIAGYWPGILSRLVIDNIVAKQPIGLQFLTNGRLCLLAHAPDCAPVNCFPLDTTGPYSYMTLLETFRSVEQPAPLQARSEAARQAVQLKPSTPLSDNAAPHRARSEPARQAVQLKRSTPLSDNAAPLRARFEPARRAVQLKPSTPMYDRLLGNLESAEDHRAFEPFIQYITDCCFNGNLLSRNERGESMETPMPLPVKMENLLRACRTQRVKQQKRLMDRGVEYAFGPIDEMHMDPGYDMREIMNTWRDDPESWMNPRTMENHRELEWNGLFQSAHQLRKRTFSTYTFQLSGCKFLLHKLLQLPLIRSRPASTMRSVEHPCAVLNKLLSDYEEHKRTKEYQVAIRSNEERQANRLRLSQELWWAQYHHSRGRVLLDMVKDNTCTLDDLTADDRKLARDFKSRRSAETLDELLKQKAFKQQPYRGHGTETSTTHCYM